MNKSIDADRERSPEKSPIAELKKSLLSLQEKTDSLQLDLSNNPDKTTIKEQLTHIKFIIRNNLQTANGLLYCIESSNSDSEILSQLNLLHEKITFCSQILEKTNDGEKPLIMVKEASQDLEPQLSRAQEALQVFSEIIELLESLIPVDDFQLIINQARAGLRKNGESRL